MAGYLAGLTGEENENFWSYWLESGRKSGQILAGYAELKKKIQSGQKSGQVSAGLICDIEKILLGYWPVFG